ncbi:hypothetical protein BLS_002020 [Venturia inaequalis]|uniref:Uncharacterized protein n=1 Tax=Venturia inaequalis TaxID=5025 RepID=A0A8H3UUI1_VENIN|nr:hypothetical protein BLS_002020 [Venturia inaequalis]
MAPPVVKELPWHLEDPSRESSKGIEELKVPKAKKDAEDLFNAKFDKLFTDRPRPVRGMEFGILDLAQELRDMIYRHYFKADNWNGRDSAIETFRIAYLPSVSFYTPSLLLTNKQIAKEAALVLREIPYVVYHSMSYSAGPTKPRFDILPINGYKTMLHLQHVKLVFYKHASKGDLFNYTHLFLAISQPSSELKSLIVAFHCVSAYASPIYGEETGWKFAPTAKNRIREIVYPSKALKEWMMPVLDTQPGVNYWLNAIGNIEIEEKGEASGMEKWEGPKNPFRKFMKSIMSLWLAMPGPAIRSDHEVLPDAV